MCSYLLINKKIQLQLGLEIHFDLSIDLNLKHFKSALFRCFYLGVAAKYRNAVSS